MRGRGMRRRTFTPIVQPAVAQRRQQLRRRRLVLVCATLRCDRHRLVDAAAVGGCVATQQPGRLPSLPWHHPCGSMCGDAGRGVYHAGRNSTPHWAGGSRVRGVE